METLAKRKPQAVVLPMGLGRQGESKSHLLRSRELQVNGRIAQLFIASDFAPKPLRWRLGPV